MSIWTSGFDASRIVTVRTDCAGYTGSKSAHSPSSASTSFCSLARLGVLVPFKVSAIVVAVDPFVRRSAGRIGAGPLELHIESPSVAPHLTLTCTTSASAIQSTA